MTDYSVKPKPEEMSTAMLLSEWRRSDNLLSRLGCEGNADTDLYSKVLVYWCELDNYITGLLIKARGQ